MYTFFYILWKTNQNLLLALLHTVSHAPTVLCRYSNVCLWFAVKCIKNTPGYFAERLHKAMAVSKNFVMEIIELISHSKQRSLITALRFNPLCLMSLMSALYPAPSGIGTAKNKLSLRHQTSLNQSYG